MKEKRILFNDEMVKTERKNIRVNNTWKYEEWIDNNYPTKESKAYKCNSAVRRITLKFPELTIQVGTVTCNGLNIYHCWAKDEDGFIVDPTAEQFDHDITYNLIAERFLDRDEVEVSTGVIFLKPPNALKSEA
tara:strand:- start:2547 stop:2945 length:399 start_codon:yes stop_codon:yes gene_type:complete